MKVPGCSTGTPSEYGWNYEGTPKKTQGRVACGRFGGSPLVAYTDSSSRLRVLIRDASIKKAYNTWANKAQFYDN